MAPSRRQEQQQMTPVPQMETVQTAAQCDFGIMRCFLLFSGISSNMIDVISLV